jgi:hypothetical protein
MSLGYFATAEGAALSIARTPEGQAVAAARAAARAAAPPPLTSEGASEEAGAGGGADVAHATWLHAIRRDTSA